ncbi:MAG: hypothetical protein JWP52_2031 [Rhizobacter sp.]|nr:hypothetical protein [Rhizobacter sp.]
MQVPMQARPVVRPSLVHSRRPRWAAVAGTALLAIAAAVSGCGGGGDDGPPALENIDTQLPAGVADVAARCDFLDASHCMLPFPNDYFTVADAITDTKLRVNMQTASMPRSVIAANRQIDTTEWNRNDGFSPGAMIVTRVPGVDLAKTGAPLLTDLSASLAKTAPVMLIDADTLEQKLVWTELDQNNVSAPDRQSLNIRVAKNLDFGHRYIVVLRNMKDAQGAAIDAGAAFRIYRDNHTSALPFVNARRAHMESIFATLKRAGVERDSLYLTWDFTVASQRNLTARMLAIRDAGFAALPNGVPTFKVKTVTDYTLAQDAKIARHIEGTFTVPSFIATPNTGTDINPVVAAVSPYLQGQAPLALDAIKAAFTTIGDKPLPLPHFNYASATPGVNDLPVRDGNATMDVPFICNIPRAALNPDGSVNPARISLYGHGLFGSPTEVNAGNVKDMSNEHNFVFCATNWYGFSATELVPSVFGFFDLSNARAPFDTTQQGILNTLVLGRAMLSAKGFSADPAFQMGSPAHSVLDTSAVFYDGNSQGGILGGALMAVSQDITRGVLGVPGMNYSLLLERSADFPEFAQMVYAAYPDGLDEQFIFSMWQMLWDRAEASAYAPFMADKPLPNTPPHKVLMHVAYGDHQVSMWSAEAEARTIGAKLHCPALLPGRHPDANPYFQIDCMDASGNFDGPAAMVVWDSGPTKVLPPPQSNLPPTAGSDPHSDPRSTPAARQQKSEFLQIGGKVVDTCNGRPCGAAGYVP